MTTCPRCARPNATDARFCQSCGEPLAAAGPPSVHETRKTVTILFCDVVGSTTLGERTDPETTRRVMSRYADAMRAVVAEHGGTVEKFRGDEVMAVFGVPTVHEDDALRAVRAGKEMQQRLAELNEELVAAWGVRLECRIGINTGEVVAGDPGTGETFVTGDAVNLAKRLEQAARPGEILIGTATYPLVKHASRFGPRYRFSAKGKREPVEQLRLDEVDATAEGYARRLDAPLVGRRSELVRLEELVVEGLTADRARVVTVLGPAGIGKSRLVREVAELVRDRADVATGRCLSYGTGATYWPLVEVLDALGGLDAISPVVAGSADGTLALDRVQAALGPTAAPVAGEELFWGVRRLLEILAARRPLVVCLEDVHWAEPTMLDLVEYLAGFAAGPLVLLCIARPDLLERRPGFQAGASVRLEQLSAGDVERLVETLGVEDAALRERIVTTADGNPLFAEQLAAAAAEPGAAVSGGGLALPASINALLEARLDELPPPERRTLERAAVVGREFWLRAVVDVSPPQDRPSVAGSLLALVRKGLIRPVEARLETEDTYRFRHALIRDAAYAGMPKAVRADLHERVARWLLAQGERFRAVEEILGYHLEQAFRNRAELGPPDAAARALAEEAAGHLLTAGSRAFARDDMHTAAGLLERAAKLLPEGDARRLAALRDQSQALWESGRPADAEAALERLLGEATAAGDARLRALAELERLVHEQLTGADSAAVEAAAGRAIELCAAAGDESGLAVAWRRLSSAHRRAGRLAAAEQAARESVRHAEAARSPHEEARAVDALCNCLLYGPTPVESALDTCAELLERTGATRSLVANVLGTVAGLEALRGEFERARDAYGRAAAILEELGLDFPRAALTQVGAPLELLAGDPVAAEREARRGAETFARVGSAGVQSPLIAEALAAQGRLEEAEEQLAATPVESGPALAQWQVHWRIARSRLLAAGGAIERAVAIAREAVTLAGATDDLTLRGDARAALAAALSAAGDADAALEALTAARDDYAAKGAAASVAALDAALAR